MYFRVVHHHIVEWLLVDRRYIINLKVEPHTHKVKMLVVEFEVVKYGQVDLAATAVHLQVSAFGSNTFSVLL